MARVSSANEEVGTSEAEHNLSLSARHVIPSRAYVIWLTKFASIDQPKTTHMNLVGEFMREYVKVGLPFPHRFPGLVTSATQEFIKGTWAVPLYSGISLEECIELELDAVRAIQFSTAPLFLRLNCVWAQKPMQQP